MQTENNAFEEKNRALKAIALVAVIMTWAQKRALDPVELIEHADLRDWLLFAKLAGCTPPSDATREVVKTAIREAAEIMQAERAAMPGSGQ